MAIEKWGKSAKNALYIGDRFDVDAECALKLGMPFVLIGKSVKISNRVRVLCVKDYSELLDKFNLR